MNVASVACNVKPAQTLGYAIVESRQHDFPRLSTVQRLIVADFSTPPCSTRPIDERPIRSHV